MKDYSKSLAIVSAAYLKHRRPYVIRNNKFWCKTISASLLPHLDEIIKLRVVERRGYAYIGLKFNVKGSAIRYLINVHAPELLGGQAIRGTSIYGVSITKTARNARVIELRKQGLTYNQIGEMEGGITRERVRQIIDRAGREDLKGSLKPLPICTECGEPTPNKLFHASRKVCDSCSVWAIPLARVQKTLKRDAASYLEIVRLQREGLSLVRIDRKLFPDCASKNVAYRCARRYEVAVRKQSELLQLKANAKKEPVHE